MRRILIALAAICLMSLAHPASAKTDQLLRLVAMELPAYVSGVDARDLSRAQLAAIYSIMHSKRSGGEKRAMIRSVLGGSYSLRSLFFN